MTMNNNVLHKVSPHNLGPSIWQQRPVLPPDDSIPVRALAPGVHVQVVPVVHGVRELIGRMRLGDQDTPGVPLALGGLARGRRLGPRAAGLGLLRGGPRGRSLSGGGHRGVKAVDGDLAGGLGHRIRRGRREVGGEGEENGGDQELGKTGLFQWKIEK